jgi:4-amino-4-deoxy-L-arabinose transferase-like glycosyltransferase
LPKLNRHSRQIRPKQVALILACATVLIRCCFLFYHYTPEKILVPDSSGYERPAVSFLATGHFVEAPEIPEFFAKLYGSAPSPQPRPMFVRTPGYPLFIAALYRLGANRRAMVIAQIVCSGIAVWLTYILGKLTFSAWAGVLAALLIAVDPATAWCSLVIISESLLSLVLIAAVVLASILLRRPGWPGALALGTMLGIATLVKPVAYYLPIPIGVVLIWGGLPKRFLAGILAPLLLLVGGWQVRNLDTVGSGMFSGVPSLDLLLWRAAGVLSQQHGIDFESAQKQAIHLIPDPAYLSPAAVNSAFFKAGLEVISAHPILFLRDTAKGLVVVLISPGAKSLPPYFGVPSIPFIAAYTLFLVLICCASLFQASVEAVAMRRNGKAAVPLLVAVVAIYVVALQAGADSGCRYRVPAMPFLAIYAAEGILRLRRRRRGLPD